VIWYTDNQNVVNNVIYGSMKSDLQTLAVEISNLRKSLDMVIFPRWIPREQNILADRISKFRDTDDWAINPNIFQYMDDIWGPYTIDRFANNLNNKCVNFNSKFNCPNSSGVDAFQYNWKKENNWLVPPINCICRTIKHMQKCNAKGTLVVPSWPSSSFWPFLVNSKGEFQSFIKDYLKYDKPKFFFQSSGRKKCVFNENFKSDVFILRMDCSK